MENQIEKFKQILLPAQKDFDNVKSGLNFERECFFACQILQANTYLQQMEKNSIITSVVNVALTGLTLNPVLAYAYLIPRKGKCILDISYKGLIKILTDSGAVKNIYAKDVFEKDIFQMEYGTNPFIKHIPILIEEKKGKLIGVYAVAFYFNGNHQFDYMTIKELEKIKQRSEAVKSGKGSPYDTDAGEMYKKTVIRRLFKTLTKSEVPDKLIKVMEIDTQNNAIDFDVEYKKIRKVTQEDKEIINKCKNEAELKDLWNKNVEIYSNNKDIIHLFNEAKKKYQVVPVEPVVPVESVKPEPEKEKIKKPTITDLDYSCLLVEIRESTNIGQLPIYEEEIKKYEMTKTQLENFKHLFSKKRDELMKKEIKEKPKQDGKLSV